MKIDVSAESFKTDLERRLAEAFEEAFIRQKLIEEGNFDSLRRRKRKKRFTQAGDAAVHVHTYVFFFLRQPLFRLSQNKKKVSASTIRILDILFSGLFSFYIICKTAGHNIH